MEHKCDPTSVPALSGFFLLLLAAELLRRKRVAWWLAVGLVISIVSHLVKGLDYEEGLLSLVLLVQLLWLRPVFTAQSDRPSIIQGLRVLVGAQCCSPWPMAPWASGCWTHYSTPLACQRRWPKPWPCFSPPTMAGCSPQLVLVATLLIRFM
jgi:lysylphosphatidylglycerol synthetase-like protein (DUF2156 family)